MTDEIKTEKKECCCKELKGFLLTILASFLGCLVALCLYSAATKPQLPPPMIKSQCPIQQFEHHRHFMNGEPGIKHFNKDFRGDKILQILNT